MAKPKKFLVHAEIKVFVGIEIQADSLEEAATKANKLEFRDIVDHGEIDELIDLESKVTGVFIT